LDDQLVHFFADGKNAEKIRSFLDKLEYKLGGWARGEIILMLMVGLTTYVGLTIIGIPFALPLALIAGILEIVPNIGPFISGIIPTIIGFSISPIAGIAAAVMAILIQQLEN
jgi:predicted PurR-regulated permease PerM